MTLLIFITFLLNPFAELESDNERLRWKLADQLTEYRHLVREYEMIMFRQHLNSRDIVNQISITEWEEVI